MLIPPPPEEDSVAFMFDQEIAAKYLVLEDVARKEQATQDFAFRVGLSIAIVMISTISGIKLMVEAGGVNLIGMLIIVVSFIAFALLFTDKRTNDKKAIHISPKLFETSPGFNVAAILVMGILVAIYAILG